MSNKITGEKVAIERDGNLVKIILVCCDQCHAMELYDSLNLDIAAGHIVLSFGVKPEQEGYFRYYRTAWLAR
jgi:hypothetical protein